RQSSNARKSPATSGCPARRFASCSRISSSQCSNSVMPDALLRDILERAAVTVERGFVARLLLPAQYGDVNILRVDIQSVADAPSLLGCNHRTTRSQERVVDNIAPLGVVQNGPSHQFDRLLRAVAGLLLVLVAAVRVEVLHFPNGGLRAVAAPIRFLALA